MKLNSKPQTKLTSARNRSFRKGDKEDDVISVPSDISNDEWAEIVRHNKTKFEEDKKKAQNEMNLKKENVRKTLEV